MPSALETLVKILKLEQETGYKNTAVIGGLQSFASHWSSDAHHQAKRPEHHQLVDELVYCLEQYDITDETGARHEAIKYMLGRIMGRVPPRADLPTFTYIPPDEPEAPVEHEPPPKPAESVERKRERPRDKDREKERVTAAPVRVEPPKPVNKEEVEFDAEFEEEDLEPAIDDYQPKAPLPHPVPSRPVSPPPRRQHRSPLTSQEIDRRASELQSSVITLPKVGVKMAEKLDKMGIRTVEDMLLTLPRRYDDYTRMRPLNRLQPGETVTVVAEVRTIVKKIGRGGQPYLLMVVDDGTGLLQVSFFGQIWLQRQFKRGSQIVLSGNVEMFRGQLMMTNPEWEVLERENLHTNRIVPVYPLTKGLSARTMRRLIHQVVEQWRERIPDYLPESVLDRTDMPDLGWAFEQAHFPESFEWLEHARRRLSFDELFIFQMHMLAHRRDWQSAPGQTLHVSDEWVEQFLGTLPYVLTGAQQRALHEIRADIGKETPMNRLLQGDVGSGKTVVAAAAMAIAVQNGKQAVLMVPTSILAEQHARSVGRLLRQSPGGEAVQVRLLTGNTSEAERQEIYAGLANGSIQVVIGTHALIQEGVTFHDLALAIVDEQHRFGVEQRGLLRGKGRRPHLLVMTATPIPRTLALTMYADLDLSVIDEMPPGRIPIDTRVLHPVERERAYDFVRSQVDKGRQVFIVYPLVETSEKLEDVGAAVDEYERLQEQVFPRQRVGLLHGRMRPAEKDEIMLKFAGGEIDVLISTSVVEVGIDVPNASVILIENADHFGLAQLHQFRGRVGRGEHTSFCLLVSGASTPEAEQRLKAMEETTDGFKLAEIDWEMRGAGDLLGLQQSGVSRFRLTELMNPRLVELAQREARTVYAEDPDLTRPEHYLLAQRIQFLLGRRTDMS